MSRASALSFVALFVMSGATAESATLREESSRGHSVVKKWSIDGAPKGVAVSIGDTIYVGLAEPQSVVAIDPHAGRITKETTLDREEIASTKDFATLRIGKNQTRLYIAQGSDESVTILTLPDLTIKREILLEGETIRDALPDPAGRYLYVLGRTVHIYDIDGDKSIRELRDLEPLALASDAEGSVLAVVGFEQFPNGKATMVAFYDPASFAEVGRMPLQTDRAIVSAFFAAGDQVIVTLASDWLGEAPARPRQEANATGTSAGEQMRLSIDFGDLVSSESICVPDRAGPQIATTNAAGSVVVFAERRCSAGTTFTASKRKTSSVSIYGVDAYAIARTPEGHYVVSDPAGHLTIYREPKKR